MPKPTPINYSVMKQTLAEVKPGTCWRAIGGFLNSHADPDILDRVRLAGDGSIEFVYLDGTVVPAPAWTAAECSRMVDEGYWIRCADEPQSAAESEK